MRRAVVTGLGVISAFGGTEATWEALLAGRVGIGPITLFDVAGQRTRLAAQIRDEALLAPFEGEGEPDGAAPAHARRLSRGDRLGLRGAAAALGDAGLTGTFSPASRRSGVLLGGGGGGLLQAEAALAARRAGEAPPPSATLGFLPATTADLIASRFGFAGHVATIMNACSSSTVAIGWGASLVRRGAQDVVLAGGVETLSRTTFAGFNALRLVDPEPCRPFDRGRAGLSLGECAAFVVIEERAAAQARGARVHGEVLGIGLSADAHHATAPDPEGAGLVRSMRAALADAGLDAGAVDHVNAHGTGTEQNDLAEARALRALFGARAARVPVVSIKGAVGHTLGAAGAIEAVATILTLRDGVIPPTAGLRDVDPACALDLVAGKARRADARVAFSNSSAFGGNNGSLLLGRHAT